MTTKPVDTDLKGALSAAEHAEQEALAAQQAAEQARAAADAARQRAEQQRTARQTAWAKDILRDTIANKAQARKTAYEAQQEFERVAPIDLQAALETFNAWQDAMHGEALIAREAWIAGMLLVNGGDPRFPEPRPVPPGDFVGELNRAVQIAADARAQAAAQAAAERREAIAAGEEPTS
jgi:hypothetical protein